MSQLDKLPPEIHHSIMLFLLDKKQLIKASGEKWCYICGEPSHFLCNDGMCQTCCRINCIDKQNVYLNYSNAPPFNEEDTIFALSHYSKVV